MPSHVPVALATLSDKPFSSPDWLFEIKWDGERALARIVDGEVEFWSRSGRNITAEYPELRGFPKRFNARKAIRGFSSVSACRIRAQRYRQKHR
jgi:bifunctional non-homologous end joining protein LigD